MAKRNDNKAPAPSSGDFDIDAPIETVGVEVKPGWYPGILIGFGDVTYFHDTETGQDKPRLDVNFLLNVGGNMTLMSTIMTPPDRGKIHLKSKLFVLLRAIGLSNPDLWDVKSNSIKAGTPLRTFIMKAVHIRVDRNPKGFDQLVDYSQTRKGAPYPTPEDAEKAVAASSDIPF